LLTLDHWIAQKLVEEEVISITVKAMQDHSSSATIQEVGCAVLANLAKLSDETKMHIVDVEALDQINLAMLCHEESVKVQARACEAILWLSIQENFKPLLASGMLQLAEKSRNRFPAECGQFVDQLIRIFDGAFAV
jgi:hypothetical protein